MVFNRSVPQWYYILWKFPDNNNWVPFHLSCIVNFPLLIAFNWARTGKLGQGSGWSWKRTDFTLRKQEKGWKSSSHPQKDFVTLKIFNKNQNLFKIFLFSFLINAQLKILIFNEFPYFIFTIYKYIRWTPLHIPSDLKYWHCLIKFCSDRVLYVYLQTYLLLLLWNECLANKIAKTLWRITEYKHRHSARAHIQQENSMRTPFRHEGRIFLSVDRFISNQFLGFSLQFLWIIFNSNYSLWVKF